MGFNSAFKGLKHLGKLFKITMCFFVFMWLRSDLNFEDGNGDIDRKVTENGELESVAFI